MIILGLDPGTTRVGFAIIKTTKDNVKPINYGCWEIREKEKGKKLVTLEKLLNKLIKEYNPELAAIEKIFFFKNAKTAMSISEAIGIIHSVLYKNHLSLIELTPLEIKQNLIGYGRAEKKDVQKIIQFYFSFKELPTPDDTADALAVALAGLNKLQCLKK
ncbi:MAG TPA: crossover junction endodeoxyribonuclease RuvC [Candidatus Paceibacterota bacterium]|nr:crossover junction endodeoxyribonuclease RuvC [Candidatus Paceibacterota bacterium]HOK97334.1 crossover junction endodeoxyribonuclease RuvC [Candidatus Paceibacterota bacterium]HPP64772.1 crossover junction endodeoxyribonuclease RuvC [Candidatus Paceibacterota bacterium]